MRPKNNKRKEQDSNLRTGFAGYTLSRRASSTTRAPFLYTARTFCLIVTKVSFFHLFHA